MKKKEWNEGMNHLDPDLVENYVEQKEKINRKKNHNSAWIRFGAVAACCCLMLTASFTVLPYLLNRDSPNDSAKVYIFSSYDSNSSKPQPSLIITATVSAYINKNNNILNMDVGLATMVDYSTRDESHYPDKTMLTITTAGLPIDDELPINHNTAEIEEEHDITDPQYLCIIDGESQNNTPSYRKGYYIDFSSLQSGDNGEIVISFTNYYTEEDDNEYEGAILRIYYAVEGDTVAFSCESVEDASEKANNVHQKIFSFGSRNDQARDD